MDLVSRASVQIIDLLLQPSDVILDTTPNFRGSTAEAVLLGGEHGRHLSSGIVDADGLDDVSFTYQWLADDTEIAGATGLTYTVAAADEGKAIKVEVSFTDDVGNDESLTSAATDAVAARPNSLATGAPTISGTVQVGETLTANRSGIADGLSKVQYEYQWPLPSGLYRIAPKRAGGGVSLTKTGGPSALVPVHANATYQR